MTDAKAPRRRRNEAARSFDKVLGAKIKAFRLKVGMSQTDLGAHLGVSFQQVQKYEMGRDRCAASKLQELAAILAVPITMFFEQVSVPVGETSDLREAMKIVAAIQKIQDPKLRRQLLALIAELARDDGEDVKQLIG